MGREIRRVPPGWKHPENAALFDRTYIEAMQEWRKGYRAWQNSPQDDCSFEEWEGPAPDPEYHLPEWTREIIHSHYQIYETVTEGTPVSPIFASLDEMRAWLIEQGFSEKATEKFIKTGWAPSMVFVSGRGVSGLGIHSLDFL